MRALLCEAYGEPADLHVRELPDPVPGPDDVVVEVLAAAVNFPDVLFIADEYQVSVPLPFTPGSEFSGRIASVGADVTTVKVGDLVMGSCMVGGIAEQVLVPQNAVSPIPLGLDPVHAAAFKVTYQTAYHALVTTADVQRGDWVVVLGAAGGVGTATVDVAHRLGARVIAAASTQARAKICAELGAEAFIGYDEENLKERIKDITGGGADLVVDPVGGRYAEQALRATRPGGMFLCLGFASGEIPRIPLNLVLIKDVTVRGMELRTMADPGALARAETDLAKLVAAGMAPLVVQTFDFDHAIDALRSVAERKASGKVVVQIGA